MLPFHPYPTLLITLNAVHVAGFFFAQASLAEISFWELSPHLRLFLMVRPRSPLLWLWAPVRP